MRGRRKEKTKRTGHATALSPTHKHAGQRACGIGQAIVRGQGNAVVDEGRSGSGLQRKTAAPAGAQRTPSSSSGSGVRGTCYRRQKSAFPGESTPSLAKLRIIRGTSEEATATVYEILLRECTRNKGMQGETRAIRVNCIPSKQFIIAGTFEKSVSSESWFGELATPGRRNLRASQNGPISML